MRRHGPVALFAAVSSVIAMMLVSLPAHAVGSVESTTSPLYDGCRSYVVNVAGSQPAAVEWDVDMTLYAPSGEVSGWDWLYGVGSSFTEQASFTVCADEGVGVYRIEGTVTWYDDEYDTLAVDDLTGSVRMVRQRTRSFLRVSDVTPAYNAPVRFRIRSQQMTPGGWRRNSYEYVALETNCSGSWQRVRRSRTLTNTYGKATLRYRWDGAGACKVRAVTLPAVNSARSRSTGIRVTPH